MKKQRIRSAIIAVVLLITSTVSFSACTSQKTTLSLPSETSVAQEVTKKTEEIPKKKKAEPFIKSAMILNADSSYGGSLDAERYGAGAPKNGEYNVENSDYYTVNNDFFNMSSTDERIIFPQFSTYQQTMADSSGIACLLMVLNYLGENVQETYTEEKLVERYEALNKTKIFGKGTTEKGLIALINDLGLGYKADSTSLKITSKDQKEQTRTRITEAIKDGKFILVRYQSPNGYNWKVVVGYDTLGNVKKTTTGEEFNSFGDDVIIFAEPNDCFDHKQDGYSTERAQDFLVWWKNITANGILRDAFSYVVIDPHILMDFEYTEIDESVKQTLYEIHLPRNPDSTYGGTRDQAKYGTIMSGRGWWNHTESNYYKINDFYNLGSEGSRILLPGYTVLQQTMSSSCGLCAVNSVLKYYGESASQYDMELSYLNIYEAVNDTVVKGSGSSVHRHKKALETMGYTSKASYFKEGATPTYASYEKYVENMRNHLQEGRPVVVSTNLGSGHYLTVIGYDDMGTDHIYDDVFITADSCDYWDGYQDGYNVFSAYKFYTQHANSSFKNFQSILVIYPKS